MRTVLAALLLACATGAAADVDVYDAGRDPGKGLIFSADGYHYAHFESSDGEDRLIVDGKVRAKGAEGTLAGPAALGADGSRLLHAVAVLDAKGNLLGVSPAINGRRAGSGVYEEIQSPALSPRGTNLAFAAKTAKGWSVVSRQGTGPAFKEPPLHLAITEKETLYVVVFGDAAWLYRDHKPVTKTAYGAASTSRDLRRLAGVYEGADGSLYVDIDGKSFGPYRAAATPVFSADGTHSAFLASVSAEHAYDALIVDGKPAAMKRCGDCSVSVDDRGRAFQDLVMAGVDERTQIHVAYLDGKPLQQGGQPPHVGLAPGGRHFVYPMLTSRGVAVGLDGEIAETGVPMPLVPAPCVFDGEEYHYWSFWGGKLLLVCGNAQGPKVPRSRCAGVARGAGWPRVKFGEAAAN